MIVNNWAGLSKRRTINEVTTRLKWLALSLLLIPHDLIADDYYLTLYGGKYSDSTLGDILVSKPIDFWDAYLGVVAVSRGFKFESPSHQWEVEAQLGKHYRGQRHWEFNIAALYRWQRFPWRKYLRTTLAIGDGLSYASQTPELEEASKTNVGATRLLNYIVIEMTVAPPTVEQWSLVARVHHRSGVFGIFDDVEGGSNIVAAGVKFRF